MTSTLRRSRAQRPIVHKRLAASVLIAVGVLVAISSSVAVAGPAFTDDDHSVHQADIEYIAARGITKGCNPPSSTRFCPESRLTRGEMAAFLVRALDLPPTDQSRFADIGSSAFEGDIEALAAAGITKGCNPPANDRYCPHDTVTRGQMAAFIARALELRSDADFFVDDSGSPFASSINAIARVGIARGCDPPANTRYCPGDAVTRGQMATYLRRVVEIDTTGTTTTSIPSNLEDAVVIEPGQNIQDVVNSHPAGSVFLVKAGTYNGQTVSPRDGDHFIGESGTILDGGNTTEYAFGGPGKGVIIEGFIVQGYSSHENTEGAFRSVGGGVDWTVRNNVIRNNRGAGIQVNPGWKIIGNHIHNNSHVGIIGGGGSGILIEGNEIAHNNAGGEGNPFIDAGGAKFFNTTDLVLRDNHAHHNGGPGLWTDGNNVGTLYEGNLVEDNDHAGIKHEISCRATIRNNTALRNGFDNDGWIEGAGIVVLNSPNVTVEGNTVRDNNDGIGGVQADRTTSARVCESNLKDFVVRNNLIEMSSGHTGIASNGGSGVFTSWGNQFYSNTYILNPASGQFFDWKNADYTLSQWRGVFPEDG